MTHPLHRIFVAALTLLGAVVATPAQAGCGCEKPPPRPAQVRPNVTYGGMTVTFFSPLLTAGQSYTATFTAMNGVRANATGVASLRRDQADAVVKPQVSVALPTTLPLGPASIAVSATGATTALLSITDANFTVAPRPVALPLQYGTWDYPLTQAAVSRDGTVYMSLDLSGMGQPLVFEAQMLGYPLRFDANGIVFKNVQGFLMQLLMQSSPTGAAPVPGMFVNPSATPTTASDQLHYSRHEFNTYFLQHAERLPHATDPTDKNWHLDGSRHIDHDHLIVAIMGRKNDGTLPAPGATPTFTLRLNAYSLFYQGLVGTSSVAMSGSAGISSYNPTTGALGTQGSVFTNGNLTMTGSSRILGDAAAATFSQAGGTSITGQRTPVSTPTTYMAVKVPAGIPDLGAISLMSGSRTIVGPGSFKVSSIQLEHSSRLLIDNSAGPVTLYVTGTVGVENYAHIDVVNPDPERFAIYVAGSGAVWLEDSGAFVGVLYAPTSPVTMSGLSLFAGAFVGQSMTVSSSAWIRYDSALRGR